MIKEKIDKILDFLKENHSHNHSLQEKNYLGLICSKDSTEDKVMSLLYEIANTQSQPKINNLAPFYMGIYNNKQCLNSFNGFIEYLETSTFIKVSKNNEHYKTLFELMKAQTGWGPKTSALFVKNIFNYHSGKYVDKLKLWNDVPEIVKEDKLYLPVDAVIEFIFTKLDESKKWGFDNINKFLHDNGYTNEEIIILDDLWFWGFITQNIIKNEEGKNERIFSNDWNENKYWMLKDAPKDLKSLGEIKEKSKEFLKFFKETD